MNNIFGDPAVREPASEAPSHSDHSAKSLQDALARIKSLEEERSFRKDLDATRAHIKLLEAREKEQCFFYELKVQRSEVALALSDKCLREFERKAMATEMACIRQRREVQSESVVEGMIFPLREILAEVEHNYLMVSVGPVTQVCKIYLYSGYKYS